MMRFNLQVLAGILVFLVIFLQFRLWLEPGGLRDMWHLKKEIARQALENENIRKHNQDLLLQIQRAQNNRDAAELRARNELGMVKKDETFYQVVN
jgi:cell division protein FtsB